MELISSQGATLTWGGITFSVTSVQVNFASGNEIEITSMSSRTVSDKENTGKMFIERDWDAAFNGENSAEISIEFFAEKWIVIDKPFELIGLKRNFELVLPENDQGEGRGLVLGGGSKEAVLTQISLGVSIGEYVTGNATFRPSGD
jgi:hypothetical protein